MGFWDTIGDFYEAAKPWGEAEAEAPPAEEKEAEKESTEEPAAKEEAKEEPASDEAKEEEEAEDEEAEEEEEEEEEETVDPKDKFEEDCKNSKQCAPAKHHYDECIERVTSATPSDSDEKEDCVEEFFHLAHCATQCAAPKLWSVLK